MVTSAPQPWVFGAFLLGLAVNYTGWYRWIRGGESSTFRYQKAIDELQLALNDTRISHDKANLAYQANKVKIQRYTALNELARNLAMTFKNQDVVVLLINSISKAFMVPAGVYTLLLFDSSMGKALHVVRYSVDTDMEVRLNREKLNPDENFNAWVISQTKPL